jgi:hypothetical protein
VRFLLLIVLGSALAACEPTPTTFSRSSGELPEGFEAGPEVVCAEPWDDFLRLEEQGAARGLTETMPAWTLGRSFDAGLVAHDFDGDGDVDLATTAAGDPPAIYSNDGTGHFTLQDPPSGWSENVRDRAFSNMAAVDLDGDRLPELLMTGLGAVVMLPNLGDMEFGAPETLWEVDWSDGPPFVASINAGDVDGDGDLDLILAISHLLPEGLFNNHDEPPSGMPPADFDRLLLNTGDGFEEVMSLSPAGEPGRSQLALFTDRDGDGDQDILIGSDIGGPFPPSAFYRNDGPGDGSAPTLVNDAPALGADLAMSAMGVAVHDLNQDGTLDYCMTDVGPLRCLLSDGEGAYVESGLYLNLQAEEAERPDLWSGWSLEMVDLDNDGALDAVATGGDPEPEQEEANGQENNPSSYDHPDSLWRGQPDGRFEDVTSAAGFGHTDNHFGMAAADFDGDGFRDIAIFGSDGPPLYWANRCGSGAWLEVELVGSPPNTEAYGARVSMTAAGRTWIQELTNLRTKGQGPSRFAFGLGDVDRIDRLTVLWPDGTESQASDVPVRRVLTVTHPDVL